MKSDIRDILIRAHELVKRGWTKGADARDKNHISVDYYDRRACKFCARGAIRKVTGFDNHAAIDAFLNYGLPASSKSACITGFNDTSDKRSVLAAFRRAIKSLQ